MFRIDDIYDEAKKIIGVCDDTKLFRWLGDAASIIVNKADLEGLKGYLDICTAGGCSCSGACRQECGSRCVTLPREVETVLAVNMEGHPALGFGQLFNFHLNGPGDCKRTCDWNWQDKGDGYCTYRDLLIPAQLVAYLENADDNGKQLLVYGYDSAGNVLRRQVSGVWQDGYQVPTIYGVAVPDVNAPVIARITRIYKEPTIGQIRLSTIDDSGTTGVLLGVYEPDETIPHYRRISLNRSCRWVRIAYMRASPIFHSRWDHIPLRSRLGFLLAVQARKQYGDLQLPEAHAFEADAARLEIEAQQKLEAPLMFPLQVMDRNNLSDKSDWQVS